MAASVPLYDEHSKTTQFSGYGYGSSSAELYTNTQHFDRPTYFKYAADIQVRIIIIIILSVLIQRYNAILLLLHDCFVKEEEE